MDANQTKATTMSNESHLDDADAFVDLLEDLFDFVDPQTAFVLEAIFSHLLEKIALAPALSADEIDLKHLILACRDTARDINGLPDHHVLKQTRCHTPRVLS